MTEIADGVTLVPSAQGNAFLVEGTHGITVVDTGMAGTPTALLNALTAAGRKPGDVRQILITHAHPDHVKGAAELRRRTSAPVLIHSADAGWLATGRVPAGGRSGAFGRVVDWLPLAHWEPVTADGELADGDLVDGALRVLHTPGHTPGHVVLIHEPTNTALVGDAVFHRGGLLLGPGAMAFDPAARPASVARIPSDVQAVGFSHGTPLTGAAVEAFHGFLAGFHREAGLNR
jgi:glyoxylase-like metal-dependent hydrolase (beta-lactamase superfamily II)